MDQQEYLQLMEQAKANFGSQNSGTFSNQYRPEPEEEERSIGQEISGGLSSASNRLGARFRSIRSEIANAAENEEMSRYHRAKSLRNLAAAQEAEEDLGLLGNVVSMAGQALPEVATMVGTGGIGLGARMAANAAMGTASTYGDTLTRQMELGQQFDSSTAMPSAIAAGVIDAGLGKARSFLPTGAPMAARVAASGAEEFASGAQHMALENLAVGEEWNKDVLLAGTVGAGLGRSLAGINAGFNFATNRGGQDAADVVGRSRDLGLAPDGNLVRDYEEYANAQFGMEDMLNKTTDADELDKIVNAKINLSATKGGEAAAMEAMDILDQYGTGLTDAALDIDVRDLGGNVNSYLGDRMGVSKDKIMKIKQVSADARPGFIRNQNAKKAAETKTSHRLNVQEKGKAALGAAKGTFKNNINFITKEIETAVASNAPRSHIQELEKLKKDLTDFRSDMYIYTGNSEEVVDQSLKITAARIMRRAQHLGMLDKLQNVNGKTGNFDPIKNVQTIDYMDRMLVSEFPSFHQGAPDISTEKGKQASYGADMMFAMGGGAGAYAAKKVADSVVNNIGAIRSQKALRKAKEQAASRAAGVRKTLEMARQAPNRDQLNNILDSEGEKGLVSSLQAGDLEGASVGAEAQLRNSGINTGSSSDTINVASEQDIAIPTDEELSQATDEAVESKLTDEDKAALKEEEKKEREKAKEKGQPLPTNKPEPTKIPQPEDQLELPFDDEKLPTADSGSEDFDADPDRIRQPRQNLPTNRPHPVSNRAWELVEQGMSVDEAKDTAVKERIDQVLVRFPNKRNPTSLAEEVNKELPIDINVTPEGLSRMIDERIKLAQEIEPETPTTPPSDDTPPPPPSPTEPTEEAPKRKPLIVSKPSEREVQELVDEGYSEADAQEVATVRKTIDQALVRQPRMPKTPEEFDSMGEEVNSVLPEEMQLSPDDITDVIKDRISFLHTPEPKEIKKLVDEGYSEADAKEVATINKVIDQVMVRSPKKPETYQELDSIGEEVNANLPEEMQLSPDEIADVIKERTNFKYIAEPTPKEVQDLVDEGYPEADAVEVATVNKAIDQVMVRFPKKPETPEEIATISEEVNNILPEDLQLDPVAMADVVSDRISFRADKKPEQLELPLEEPEVEAPVTPEPEPEQIELPLEEPEQPTLVRERMTPGSAAEVQSRRYAEPEEVVEDATEEIPTQIDLPLDEPEQPTPVQPRERMTPGSAADMQSRSYKEPEPVEEESEAPVEEVKERLIPGTAESFQSRGRKEPEPEPEEPAIEPEEVTTETEQPAPKKEKIDYKAILLKPTQDRLDEISKIPFSQRGQISSGTTTIAMEFARKRDEKEAIEKLLRDMPVGKDYDENLVARAINELNEEGDFDVLSSGSKARVNAKIQEIRKADTEATKAEVSALNAKHEEKLASVEQKYQEKVSKLQEDLRAQRNGTKGTKKTPEQIATEKAQKAWEDVYKWNTDKEIPDDIFEEALNDLGIIKDEIRPISVNAIRRKVNALKAKRIAEENNITELDLDDEILEELPEPTMSDSRKRLDDFVKGYGLKGNKKLEDIVRQATINLNAPALTEKQIGTAMAKIDKEVVKIQEALDAAEAEKKAIKDEEQAAYNAWKQANPDDTVESARLKKRLDAAIDASEKAGTISKGFRTRVKNMAAKRKSEAEKKANAIQELDRIKKESEDLNAVNEQIEGIRKIMSDRGASDFVIDEFLEANFRYRMTPYSTDALRGKENAALNRAKADIKEFTDLRNKITDAKADRSKEEETVRIEMSNGIKEMAADMDVAQLEELTSTLLKSVENIGGSIDGIKAMAANLKAVREGASKIANRSSVNAKLREETAKTLVNSAAYMERLKKLGLNPRDYPHLILSTTDTNKVRDAYQAQDTVNIKSDRSTYSGTAVQYIIDGVYGDRGIKPRLKDEVIEIEFKKLEGTYDPDADMYNIEDIGISDDIVFKDPTPPTQTVTVKKTRTGKKSKAKEPESTEEVITDEDASEFTAASEGTEPATQSSSRFSSEPTTKEIDGVMYQIGGGQVSKDIEKWLENNPNGVRNLLGEELYNKVNRGTSANDDNNEPPTPPSGGGSKPKRGRKRKSSTASTTVTPSEASSDAPVGALSEELDSLTQTDEPKTYTPESVRKLAADHPSMLTALKEAVDSRKGDFPDEEIAKEFVKGAKTYMDNVGVHFHPKTDEEAIEGIIGMGRTNVDSMHTEDQLSENFKSSVEEKYGSGKKRKLGMVNSFNKYPESNQIFDDMFKMVDDKIMSPKEAWTNLGAMVEDAPEGSKLAGMVTRIYDGLGINPDEAKLVHFGALQRSADDLKFANTDEEVDMIVDSILDDPSLHRYFSTRNEQTTKEMNDLIKKKSSGFADKLKREVVEEQSIDSSWDAPKKLAFEVYNENGAVSEYKNLVEQMNEISDSGRGSWTDKELGSVSLDEDKNLESFINPNTKQSDVDDLVSRLKLKSKKLKDYISKKNGTDKPIEGDELASLLGLSPKTSKSEKSTSTEPKGALSEALSKPTNKNSKSSTNRKVDTSPITDEAVTEGSDERFKAGALTKEEIDIREARKRAEVRRKRELERSSTYPKRVLNLDEEDALTMFDELLEEGLSRSEATDMVMGYFSQEGQSWGWDS